MSDHLKNLSQVYLEQIAEFKEKVEVAEADSLAAMQARREKRLAAQRKREGTTSTGRDFGRDDSLSADQQKKRRDAEFKAGLEKGKTKTEEVEVDEAMSSYDRNRKRAAQRAAERNAARAAGKTGVVPGIGYVSPRKERETYVDSAGTTRHKSGAKMESLDPVGKEDADVDNDGKKNDSNDKYILKRREAIRKAIAAKKKVSEQLGEELVIEVSGEEKEVKIKEKKVNNKIIINPELKESISEIGGEVLFISEVDEVDSIAESVHIELIEEGYSEDQVVEAIKYAIDEVTNPAKVAAFKMKKAKYTPKPETKEEPKKSLKDRIKSVAKKALDKTAETAGKIMKKKAEIQAAPAKAKKKLGSYVDRAKAVAKAGYERGRGPIEKKPTTYRGAGAGRKEKIGEEVATDPKMQQLQKKQIMLDRQKLSARVQAMQKKKPAPEQAQEELSIDQQMKISRDAAKNRNPKPDHKAIRGKMLRKPLPKDTRTDAQKMTDAVGKPRMGSSD